MSGIDTAAVVAIVALMVTLPKRWRFPIIGNRSPIRHRFQNRQFQPLQTGKSRKRHS
jgi:hypothetical protein